MRPTRASLWLAVAIVLVGGACTIRLLSDGGAAQAAGASVRFFDVNCPIATQGNFDPLKFPGQANSTHLHKFFGNTLIDQNSTGTSLLAANQDGLHTTCKPIGVQTGPPGCTQNCGGQYSCAAFDPSGNCPAYRETDGSGYWVPALYDCGTTYPGDTVAVGDPRCTELVPTSGGAHLYYFARQTVNGPAVEAFQTGFGEIQGDKTMDTAYAAPCPPNTAAAPLAAAICGHEWRCLSDTPDHPTSGSYTYTNIDNGVEQASQGYSSAVGFNCWNKAHPTSDSAQLQISVHMAECWDGVMPTTGATGTVVSGADVRYAVNKICPAGFPHLLPAVTIQIGYNTRAPFGVPHFYRLAISSTLLGSTSSSHGDMFEAWGDAARPSQLTTLVNSCLNVSQSGIVPGCNVSP